MPYLPLRSSALAPCLLAGALACPGQEVLVWRNPKPQGLDLHAVDFPARNYPDSGVGIAVGRLGTVIRTLDAGASWSRIPLVTSADLEDVDMVDDRTGYAVGSEGTVLKTLDGGMTWSAPAQATSQTLHRCHFFTTDTGFVVGDSGTLLSTRDGGSSWKKDSLAPGPLRGIDFVDRKVGYIVGGQDEGILLKTEDGGETWQRLPFQGGYLTTVGRDIAFGWNTAAEPWKLGRVVDLPDSTFNSNRVASFVNSVRLRHSDGCAAGWNEVSVTSDGGRTWRTTRLETSENLNDVRFTSNNTLVAVGSNGFIARSSDRGLTWTFSPERLRGRIIRLQSLAAGVGFASAWDEARGNSGLYRTRDAWRTIDYVDFRSRQEVRSLHFPTDRIGYGVRDSLFRTGDGGTTWTPVPLPFGAFPAYLGEVHFLNPDTGFLAEGRGDSGAVRLFKTSDAGRTWKQVLDASGGRIKRMRFPNPRRGYALGRFALHATADGGESWTRVDAWQGESRDMDFVDENVGFVVHGGRLHRTRDGGSTWSTSTHPDVADIIGVRFRDASVGFLAAYGEGPLRGWSIRTTRDGGETWTQTHKGAGPFLWTLDVSPEGQAFAAGEKGGIVTLSDREDGSSILRETGPRKIRIGARTYRAGASLWVESPKPGGARDFLGRIRARRGHAEPRLYPAAVEPGKSDHAD